MLQSTLITLAFGVALSFRFKALVLLPVTLLVLLLAIVAGLSEGESFSSVFLTGFLAAAKIQIGYALGLGVSRLIQPDRLRTGVDRDGFANESESQLSR